MSLKDNSDYFSKAQFTWRFMSSSEDLARKFQLPIQKKLEKWRDGKGERVQRLPSCTLHVY